MECNKRKKILVNLKYVDKKLYMGEVIIEFIMKLWDNIGWKYDFFVFFW